MAIPADLKFDVRVRERLLSAGHLTEAEVNQHLEGLPDLQAQAVDLTVKQPALQAESDRDIVIVRASGARPPVAPVRPIEDELDLPIPDDDDDDDDDLKVVDREKIAAAEKKKAPEPAEVSSGADEEDDDEDEDDEDEDEDEDDEEKSSDEKPEEES